MGSVMDESDPQTPHDQSSQSISASPMVVVDGEVTGLNDKLVAAIERQAELEDILATSRHELEMAKHRVRTLEESQEEYTRMLASGELIQKQDVDLGRASLTKELMEERGHRLSAEGSRKEIEKELEDLTSSLFEEANKMVAVERMENATLRERNEHLATQLRDTEVLVASHQAQLEELKSVMQKMSERDVLHDSRPASPNPNRGHASRYSRDSMKGLRTPLSGSFPSPIVSQRDDALDSTSFASEADTTTEDPASAEIPPEEDPEQSAGLLMPRYRTDILSYTEFLSLLHHSRTVARPPLSRVASTSSLGHGGDGQGTAAAASASSPKDSLASRHPGVAPNRAGSPSLDRSMSTSGTLWTRYANDHQADIRKEKETPLRDAKFMKRALLEDIEPTLRLDQGPELGYLSRRSILNAVVEGNLIVEPMPAHLARYRPDRAPCALCGDARYTEHTKRPFRLKTSDKTESQPYPLCLWCTDRVRSVCTYVAFLKQVKDGLWKATTESEEIRVWEESVKLRESMFWSRVGHIVDI